MRTGGEGGTQTERHGDFRESNLRSLAYIWTPEGLRVGLESYKRRNEGPNLWKFVTPLGQGGHKCRFAAGPLRVKNARPSGCI